MKRDMDLCRRILLAVEGSPPGESVEMSFVDDYPKNVVARHVGLLSEAGLVEAETGWNPVPMDTTTLGYYVTDLTWAGHDFLDAARDEGRWTKAKQHFADAGVSVTLTLLKEKLDDLARAALGLGS